MNEIPVVILGVKPYSFENEQKQKLEGVTVHYYSTQPKGVNVKHTGFIPAKCSVPTDQLGYLEKLKFPASARAIYTIDLANNRNPIKITGFLESEAITK